MMGEALISHMRSSHGTCMLRSNTVIYSLLQFTAKLANLDPFDPEPCEFKGLRMLFFIADPMFAIQSSKTFTNLKSLATCSSLIMLLSPSLAHTDTNSLDGSIANE